MLRPAGYEKVAGPLNPIYWNLFPWWRDFTPGTIAEPQLKFSTKLTGLRGRLTVNLWSRSGFKHSLWREHDPAV